MKNLDSNNASSGTLAIFISLLNLLEKYSSLKSKATVCCKIKSDVSTEFLFICPFVFFFETSLSLYFGSSLVSLFFTFFTVF